MTQSNLLKKSVFIVDSKTTRWFWKFAFFLFLLVITVPHTLYSFNSVVIYPFQNQLTDNKLYWLPRGIAETTANSIYCPDDYLLKPDDIADLYEQIGLASNMDLTYATLIKMSQLNNIQYALIGTIKNINNNVTIEAKIFNTKTAASIPIKIEGNFNNIFALQTQLVKALVDFFNAHGIKAFQQNDIYKAISPYSFEMYIKALQEEQNEKKIKFLKQALKENKSFAAATVAIAQAYYEMEDYDNALQYLTNVPADSSLYPKALFYGATIYARKNDHNTALNNYLEASKYQRSSSLFNNIAAILIKQDDLSHAQWYMEQAITIIPDDYDLIFNHAILSYLSGNYTKAKFYLITYLNKFPENSVAYIILEQVSHKDNNELSAALILDLANKHKDFTAAKEKFDPDLKNYLIFQYNIDEELMKKYAIIRNKQIDDNIIAALRSYKERAKDNIKNKEYQQSLDDLFKAA